MIPKVYYLDDNLVAGQIMQISLNRYGFSKELHFFSNGFEFETFIKEKSKIPDQGTIIVFLDLNVPGYPGWDILEYYQSISPAPATAFQFIVLSSTLDPDDFDRARKYPFVLEFCTKPISKAWFEKLKQLEPLKTYFVG
jgi:hypothetical protein